MRKNCRRATEKLVLFSLAVVSCGACQLGSAAPEAFKLVAAGRVEGAGDVMAIGTAATGVIAELDVREGERVGANQLLVRVQCASIEKELEARKSSLAAAEAVLARVVQGNRQEEIDVGVADVGLAEAKWEEAGIALRRALALTEGVTITKAQVDQAKRDARITAAQRDEARARLALLRAGSRHEDILQAQHTRDAHPSFAVIHQSDERHRYGRADKLTGGHVGTENDAVSRRGHRAVIQSFGRFINERLGRRSSPRRVFPTCRLRPFPNRSARIWVAARSRSEIARTAAQAAFAS